MIDHIGVRVADVGKSRTFYDGALAPLGYGLVTVIPASVTGDSDVLGYGEGHRATLWVARHDQRAPTHVALIAKSKAHVDAFYRAAIAAGGKDNGAPGPRPHYHAGYYGAFVLDLDGNNIEAVCHDAG